MTMLSIPKKAKFEYQGLTGVIDDVQTRYVVLDFDDQGLKMLEPHQLQSAYASGEFKILKAKIEAVLHDLSDPLINQRFHFISTTLQHMHESGRPNSVGVIEEALKLATSKHGMFDGRIPSVSSAKRWYKKWINNDQSVAYVLGKSKVNRRSQFDERNKALADDVIQQHYLQLNGQSVRATYNHYLEEFNTLLPRWERENAENSHRTGEKITIKPMCINTFYTYVSKLDSYEVDRARMGVKAAIKKHRCVQGSIITRRPLERVEVDAVHLNIALSEEDSNGNQIFFRPIVHIAIDVLTRLIVGFFIQYGDKNASESSSAVINLLKHVCNPFKVGKHTSTAFPLGGKPEKIVSDSGTAYIAATPKAMLGAVGITHEVTPKASPWKKPFVERFMGTLKSQCLHSIDGYAGSRKRGVEFDRTIEQMAHLSCDEFESILENYILNIYHNNPHKGLDDLTPIEAWEEVKDRCPPQLACDFTEIAKYRGQRESRKICLPKGITIKGVQYNCPELQKIGHQLERQFKDRKVQLMFDPLDISEITVINPLTNGMLVVQGKSVNVF